MGVLGGGGGFSFERAAVSSWRFNSGDKPPPCSRLLAFDVPVVVMCCVLVLCCSVLCGGVLC